MEVVVDGMKPTLKDHCGVRDAKAVNEKFPLINLRSEFFGDVVGKRCSVE